MQASEIISKKVISVYEAKYVGTVEDILLNKNSHKLMFLKIYDELDDEYTVLSSKHIYQLGEHAILIKNLSVLHLKEHLDGYSSLVYNPLNTQLFNLMGDEMGTVCDISFTNNYKVENIIINGNSNKILPKNLLSVGNEICILNSTTPKKMSGFSPRKKMPRPSDYAVNIITNNASTIENTNLQEVVASHEQPKRIITDYRFLLNRKITGNIFSQSGELLLRKNSVINAQSITKARLNGKLIELTQKSKQ